jgi:putative intracellular protease/amidase
MKKIGVLIEAHYDETEFNLFNEAFTTKDGYALEYLSHLWDQSSLSFKGNDLTSEVTVSSCVTKANIDDFDALILIGGYAMDRLRYQAEVADGVSNQAPALVFLRQAVRRMEEQKLVIGTICHSLWLFCADPAIIKDRKVTCAHNIICDVVNAGGKVQYEGKETRDIVVDGGLITARHPGVTGLFIETLKKELERIG